MLKLFNNARLSTTAPRLMKNQRGMTLIEILIVMALVTGLMAALVSQIFPRLSKAERRQAEVKMRTLMQALELYRTDCQKYPNNEVGLKALLEKPADCRNWGPEAYVKNENDLRDSWDNEFTYENQNTTYIIRSYGKDGVEGGTGNSEDFTSETL